MILILLGWVGTDLMPQSSPNLGGLMNLPTDGSQGHNLGPGIHPSDSRTYPNTMLSTTLLPPWFYLVAEQVLLLSGPLGAPETLAIER